MAAFVLILVFLIFYIWLCWFLANQFYEAAKAKGFSDKKYFWITFWLGPIGYLLVIALPDRGNNMVNPGSNMIIPENNVTNHRNSISVLYDELPDL